MSPFNPASRAEKQREAVRRSLLYKRIVYNCFMVSKKQLMALAGVTVLIVALVVAVVKIPRVHSTSPASGALQVDPNEPLQIQFTQPMNPESVASHLTIDPNVNGSFQWTGNTLTFIPAEPWPEGKTIQVRLSAGSRSKQGLWTLQATSWNFTVRHSWVLFLLEDDNRADLYQLDPITQEIELLVKTGLGILDFNVNHREPRVIYSAVNATGGSDLYSLRLDGLKTALVLPCSTSRCTSPVLSPDGKQLAYLRVDQPKSSQPAPAQVWLRQMDAPPDQAGKQITRLSLNAQHLSWSPENHLLYYDSSRKGFVLVDSAGSEMDFIRDETGEPGTWCKQGYVYPEILYASSAESASSSESAYASHLFLYSLATRQKTDLTGNHSVEDLNPVVSPDGTRIAFARRYTDAEHWTPGRQLWVMDLDGTDSHPLTNDPLYNHAGISWSPDSQNLAYTRFNTANLNEILELWLTNATSGISSKVLVAGYDPQWVP